jgi:hypothetical protein
MTNVPGGLGSQLGVSPTESTYGTYNAPTRFVEFNSESLKLNKRVKQGLGLRAGGLFGRSARRVVTGTDVTGDIDFDMPTRGAGIFLGHALGSYPAAVAGAFTIVKGDQSAVSFTTQVGLSRYDGTVTPKNVTGCKVDAFTLSLANDGILNVKLTIDAQKMEFATALVAASYNAAYDLFHFAQGTIKVDGTAVGNIRDWSVTIANNLKKDRYNIGNSGLKSTQTHDAFVVGTGAVTVEFTDTTWTTKLTADSVTSIDMIFTNGTEILEIITPVVFADDATPMVSGPSDIDVPITFSILDNGTLAPITVIYTTPDSTL